MKQPAFFARSELTATLWAFRREFLVVGLFSGIANLLMLTPTVYMLQVYDRVLASGSELTLVAVSLMTLLLLCVMAVAEWSRSRVLVRAGVRLDRQLSTRVFNASFEASLAESGVNPERSFTDLTQIRQFLTGNGIFAFFDTPWVPIYIAVLFLMHPFLGWLAIGFALIQGALAWLGHSRTVKPSEDANQAQGDAQQFLQSKLRNAEVLESMGMFGALRRRWGQRHATYMRLNTHAQEVAHRITAYSKVIRYSQQSLALGAGALLVINGELSPGAMIASNVLTTRALAPIDQLVSTWRAYLGARAAFDRLEKLLAEHPERDPALTRVPPTGQLSLRDVVATAAGRQEPILKRIHLDVLPGTVTAVLGPSGSGKSTLARVMVGIWPEVAGEVLLDERPLAGWSRTELGPHIGYLPQDIELFEGTIAENICRFSALDSDKIIAAARLTGLHDMILRFPKGYDTPMGEAGNLLSGGQRQRIGLARAVYGEPALIVLDEPNANLDDPGETALVAALRELREKGKAVVMVTHRTGSIMAADRLVILRDGTIQFNGPRDEVLAALKAMAPGAPPARPASPPAPVLAS